MTMNSIDIKKSMDYQQDYLMVAAQLYYWMQKRPDSNELKALSAGIADINKYVTGLQQDLAAAKTLINDHPNNK